MSSSEPYAETSAVRRRESKELRDTFDPKKAAAIDERLARNHTWQVPTLTVLRAMANLDDPKVTSDVRLKYMPCSIREEWNPQNDFRLKQRTGDHWLEAKKTYVLYERIVGGRDKSALRTQCRHCPTSETASARQFEWRSSGLTGLTNVPHDPYPCNW